MLTPSLIRLAYWLGLLAVIWIGLEKFFSSGFFGIFEAVVFVAIGAIGLRVLAEIIMLFFQVARQYGNGGKKTVQRLWPWPKPLQRGQKQNRKKPSRRSLS